MSVFNKTDIRDIAMPELRQAICDARGAYLDAQPTQASGCGRAYVAFTGRMLKHVVVELEAVGFKMFKAPFHKQKVIYIGYDNHDGLAQGQARAVADAFQEHGISCYVDLQGD